MSRARIAALTIAAALAGCGNANDYGGQYRYGADWQEVTLRGCSAEVMVRVPTALLRDFGQNWASAPAPDRPNATLALQSSHAALANLMPTGVGKALASSFNVKKPAGASGAAWLATTGCEAFGLSFYPNHRRPAGGSLVTRNLARDIMLSPESVPLHGLRQFNGRVTGSRDFVNITAAGPGSIWLACWDDSGKVRGYCTVRKDHSDTVQLEYHICTARLADWRVIDAAMGQVADAMIVQTRPLRQVDAPA